jgi:hypothetical protein
VAGRLTSPEGCSAGHELPPILWLWFPPVLILVQYGFRAWDQPLYRRVFEGELGAVELATPVVALVAAGVGVAAWCRGGALPRRWLRGWLVLVTFGCIYIAGEELSWGQHLFGWSTPDYIGTLNDQKETNIHNISSWFDQKPRLLLESWVLIGGIIYPLAGAARRGGADDWRDWFWPTLVCVPSALLAILVRLPERLQTWLDLPALPLAIRYSEPQEYYFSLFLLIYLASIRVRLQQAQQRPAAPGALRPARTRTPPDRVSSSPVGGS